MKRLSTALLFFLSAHAALAQSIGPDATFGNNGVVVTPESGHGAMIYSTALQSDGRIVAAGERYNDSQRHVFLVRYLPDGAVDPGFGVQGKVRTSVGTLDGACAVIVQADGKITVAGNKTVITELPGPNPSVTISSSPFLIRYLPNGTLDNTFGTNGIHHLDILNPYADKEVAAIAQLPDGRLVVGGTSTSFSPFRQMIVVCLNLDGSYSQSFGTGGLGMYSIEPGEHAALYDLCVQPDGKMLLAGYSGNASLTGPIDTRMGLARINTNGLPDAGFGTNGMLAIPLVTGGASSFDIARRIRVRPNGKILAAGASEGHLAMVQRLADGSPDPSFGTNGIVTDGSRPPADGLSMLTDGRLMVSGLRNSSGNNNVHLSRFHAAGSIDPTFGTSGNMLIDQSDKDRAYDLLIQPDEKILLAGHSEDPVSDEVSFTLWRLADTSVSTGVGHVNLDGMQLYPNPAANYLTLSFPEKPARPLAVMLFNLLGQPVLRKTVQSQVSLLSLEKLAGGTYLLQMTTDTGTRTYKIVKQ